MDLQDLARHAAAAANVAVARQRARDTAVRDALISLRNESHDRDTLCHRKSSWLVAHTDDRPDATYSAPPTSPYRVIAADGSQITPDRHDGLEGIALIHTATVEISYGDNRRARFARDTELVDLPEVGEGSEDSEVSFRRFQFEAQALQASILREPAHVLPTVVLVDGSLIAWHLDAEGGLTGARADAFRALMSLFDVARSQGVPVVGYVSRPASRDVVNGLRVLQCPTEPVSCPHPRDMCPCAVLSPATDEALFASVLSTGERSAIFTARGQASGESRILRRYGEHWIDFCYLHVGDEVARIEAPRWVVENADLVQTVHAICIDQCRKGRGYPIALSEAHEHAVVRAQDRQAFLDRVSRETVRAGGRPIVSAKARAKRQRAL